MYELIMKVPEHDVMGFLLGGFAIACGTTIILSLIIARCWGRYNQRQLASPLIQEMLDRGMSSGEIESIFGTAYRNRPRFFARWFRNHAKSLSKLQATS